ncbi:ABC transporter ATP-binding protein [Breznakiellaceae bacterium SP9]
MSLISISGVTKSFDKVLVISEFNERIADKEFVTLLGPSGCGKTTMLRMIAGFERPTKGEIRIDDHIVNADNVFVPPEKRNIGMVFQSYAVWPHMTVFENVAYPLKIARLHKTAIKEKVEWILEAVHLSQYAARIPSQLSGGQQQRVALGRALVSAPKVLLLDEPLSNLDAKLRESMRFEIKEIQRNMGITVVYVTHDQTEAMAMSDRIIVMKDGLVQQVGNPTTIYRRPANQFVADFVGKINFIKGSAGNGQLRLNGVEQTIPYDGPYTGNIILAVRPENIAFTSPAHPVEGVTGSLEGTLLSMFYLGDVNDCHVDIAGVNVRVLAESRSFESLSTGQKVTLGLKEFIVYPDSGMDETGIVT